MLEEIRGNKKKDTHGAADGGSFFVGTLFSVMICPGFPVISSMRERREKRGYALRDVEGFDFSEEARCACG
ncbi:MAG: hypothetical protein LC781_07765 [Actinobacteria bacterium]|nr:hypothetical protein [Actinomycetota bacterium]